MRVRSAIRPRLRRATRSPLAGGSGRTRTLGGRAGQPLSTTVISRKAYPSATGAISITTGTGHYRKNGGSWVSTAGTLVATDYIEARVTSSGSYATAVELVFSIDGSPDTFTVTTLVGEADGFPYTFPFELG